MKKNGENKTSYTREEIHDALRSGDQLLIAEILECTSDYVRMVLSGIRNSDRVLALASDWIEYRQAFIAKHKAQ